MILDFLEDEKPKTRIPNMVQTTSDGKEKFPHSEEYEGRTFGEVVPELRRMDGLVKIGMKHTSGFFFIGDKCKLTDEFVDELDGRLVKILENKVKNAEDSLSNAISAIPTFSRYIAAQYKANGTFSDYRSYIAHINVLWAKLDNYKKQIDDRLEDLRDRIPLTDRVILEAYPSIDPAIAEPMVILLIEGLETGAYSLLEEYEADYGESTRRSVRKRRKVVNDD